MWAKLGLLALRPTTGTFAKASLVVGQTDARVDRSGVDDHGSDQDLKQSSPLPIKPPDMRLPDPVEVVGILLVYYEKYQEAAIRRFSKLVRSVSKNSRVIVVWNGSKSLAKLDPDVIQVDGDNSLREFSGWDKGIATARKLGLLEASDLVIFANDTFCFHNKFGPITRYCFQRAFRNALEDRASLSLVGERFNLGATAVIRGLPLASWVSTYLFAISRPLMRELGQVAPPFDMSFLVHKSASGEVELTDEVSSDLAKYLANWMGLSGTGESMWYGAKVETATSADQQVGKLRSILAEKYLSAACQSLQAKTIDVFPGKAIKQLRRLEKMLDILNQRMSKF